MESHKFVYNSNEFLKIKKNDSSIYLLTNFLLKILSNVNVV